MSPEPSDPQDAQVAQMYMNDRPRFDQTARYWTESYAMGKTHADKIRNVVEMGFPEVRSGGEIRERVYVRMGCALLCGSGRVGVD